MQNEETFKCERMHPHLCLKAFLASAGHPHLFFLNQFFSICQGCDGLQFFSLIGEPVVCLQHDFFKSF